MPTVGLICEGPTDQAVLRRLLDALSPGVAVNGVQPPHPMGPGDFGGWHQVFAALREGRVGEALAFNDGVVVQIDTDVCEESGFDVPRRVDGRERTHAELVAAVQERLVSEIGAHDPEADLSRVAFAICVNELECWLLLHLGGDKELGCFESCNRALRKRGEKPLNKGDVRTYEVAAKGLRKRAAVDAIRGRSAGLDRFLAEIEPLLP